MVRVTDVVCCTLNVRREVTINRGASAPECKTFTYLLVRRYRSELAIDTKRSQRSFRAWGSSGMPGADSQSFHGVAKLAATYQSRSASVPVIRVISAPANIQNSCWSSAYSALFRDTNIRMYISMLYRCVSLIINHRFVRLH